MDVIFVILIAVAALVLGAVGGFFVYLKVINGKYKEKEISSSHSGRGEYSLAVFDSDTGTLYYYRLKTG